jgi:DNA-binding MarR family transcriptional regulator
VNPLDFSLGLACGLAVAAALYLVLRRWARRTISSSSPSERVTEPPAGAREDHGHAATALPAPTIPATSPPMGDSPGPPRPPAPAPNAPIPSLEEEYAPKIDRSPAPLGAHSTTEAVRLSQRVILHVYAQGNIPPGSVAPPGLCQGGIGEALGVTQGGLAAVLRRLEAAGIFTVERGHVQGRDRRLKIYRLSSYGLEVARELRGRSARKPGMSDLPKTRRGNRPPSG